MRNLCSRIGDTKDSDKIPNKILKMKPNVFTRFFKNCLQIGKFPNNWKKQKLILISKPGKTLGEPQFYSVLVTIGKCLERFI